MMEAKCALCDKIDIIEDNSPQGKYLKNSRVLSYLCEDCKARITKHTKERKATGNFHLNSGIKS
ncbi:MAG TPA: YlaI family protein [Pseudogracilibacillus sp.]|nr:YlaI family protein [Pseudogracilibacillus sp.]